MHVFIIFPVLIINLWDVLNKKWTLGDVIGRFKRFLLLSVLQKFDLSCSWGKKSFLDITDFLVLPSAMRMNLYRHKCRFLFVKTQATDEFYFF